MAGMELVPWKVLDAGQPIASHHPSGALELEIDKRPDENSKQGFIGAGTAAQGSKARSRCPHPLPERSCFSPETE